MKTYSITVKKQGAVVKSGLKFAAPSALAAIDHVIKYVLNIRQPQIIVMDGKRYEYTGYDLEAREVMA